MHLDKRKNNDTKPKLNTHAICHKKGNIVILTNRSLLLAQCGAMLTYNNKIYLDRFMQSF